MTNGFDIIRVMAALGDRIGWVQPLGSGMPVLDEDNTTSLSGRYYDDFHAMAIIRNVYSMQDNPVITDEEFNAYLARLKRSVIMRVLNAIFNKPALIDHTLFYTRTWYRFNRPIPNADNVAGYKINIAQGDYRITIDSVSLYFDGVATFNVYLFNDIIELPLYSKEVTTVANSQTKVQLGWDMVYNNPDFNGGVYYLVYFQRDLGDVQALDEQMMLKLNTFVFGAFPVQAAAIGDLNFNRNNPGAAFYSYGMNPEISSYRDYTRVITQNPHEFDEAIGLTNAIQVLEGMKYSSRNNNTERINESHLREMSLDMNMAQPTNDFPFVAGLKQQLSRELSRVQQCWTPKLEVMGVTVFMPNDFAGRYLDQQISTLPNRQLPT